MYIAVISDTHRMSAGIMRAAEHIKEMDLVIHLGDNAEDVLEIKKVFKKEVVSVKGNCDFISSIPNERIEEIEGKRFLITHGHQYDVKRDLLKLKYRAKEINADVVLFGHTHISEVVFEEGIWFINPGSASLPRGRAASIAILELKNEEIYANIKDITR